MTVYKKESADLKGGFWRHNLIAVPQVLNTTECKHDIFYYYSHLRKEHIATKDSFLEAWKYMRDNYEEIKQRYEKTMR